MRDAGGADLADTIEAECSYLVNQRQRSAAGGWSYFPGLPELPPDIDVLAEVMQVLTRCKRRRDLLAYVERPLLTVLRDGVRPNGSVGTWIVRKDDRSNLEARQARFIEVAWGDSADVEVVANFLFALALYDRGRFGAVLHQGVRYLQGQQTASGCWRSTWYVGPFYGTYVCARTLASMSDRSTLARARSFLLESQREDGGWGSGLICCQLGTALALCGICVIAEALGVTALDCERIAEGVRALAGALKMRGGWHASPFIRMNVGRIRGEKGPMLLYQSAAITAAFALKASIAVRQAMAIAP
jgi:squalene-hopene/tetraprenyl-beta-curcumene cyclase